jgi:hypothetical protein
MPAPSRHPFGSHELNPTPFEEVLLRFDKRAHLLSAGLAVLSLLLVWLMPRHTAVAGLVYGLMGPLHGWNGYLGGKAQAAIRARQLAVNSSEGQPGG